jgi:hypothetical protein
MFPSPDDIGFFGSEVIGEDCKVVGPWAAKVCLTEITPWVVPGWFRWGPLQVCWAWFWLGLILGIGLVAGSLVQRLWNRFRTPAQASVATQWQASDVGLFWWEKGAQTPSVSTNTVLTQTVPDTVHRAVDATVRSKVAETNTDLGPVVPASSSSSTFQPAAAVPLRPPLGLFPGVDAAGSVPDLPHPILGKGSGRRVRKPIA